MNNIMKPIISVIIPCYNSEKTIYETVMSIINQENINKNIFELIIVNDKSTDLTEFEVKKIQVKFSPFTIRLINLKENRGVSYARNVGLHNAKGKWVLFLDSDDVLNKYALSKIIRNDLVFPKCELLAFGYYVNKNGKLEDYSKHTLSVKNFFDNQLAKFFLSKKINLHISSVVFKKNFLQKNNILFPTGQKVAEDLQFIIHCLIRCHYSIYDEYQIFIYQINDFSVMQGYNKFSTAMAKSIVELNAFFNKLTNDIDPRFLNFYIVNFFVYNLWILFKSKIYSKKAISILENNMYILSKKIYPFNIKLFIILKLVQNLPKRILIAILIWRKKSC